MKKDQLKEFLTKFGVEFSADAKATELESLLGQYVEGLGGGTPHIVTQEDLDMNPGSGLALGDAVVIPHPTMGEPPQDYAQPASSAASAEQPEAQAKPAASSYVVLSNLLHDGVAYAPGETVDLPAKAAETLLADKIIKASS